MISNINVLPENQNQRVKERILQLNERLMNTYPNINVDGEERFFLQDGGVFALEGYCWGDFGGYGDCIVVVSGDSQDAPRTTYEDDGIYSLDEMEVEEMAAAIVNDMGL